MVQNRLRLAKSVATATGLLLLCLRAAASTTPAHILPTGERISPTGREVSVGSFPSNMVVSPNARFLVVSDTGFREYLSVINCRTGALVSQIGLHHGDWHDSRKLNLYYGLAFAPKALPGGSYLLYVSYGSAGAIGVYTLSPGGLLRFSGSVISLSHQGAGPALFPSGIAVSSSGKRVYIANNETTNMPGLPSSLAIIRTRGTQRITLVQTPGFAYAVAAVTRGKYADKKVYVSSERDGVVSDVYVGRDKPAHLLRNIRTGDHPIALLLDRTNAHLFVANASSDSISLMSTGNDHVMQNLSLRGPSGLPGVTPTGLALNSKESRLYVTLADKNAVAVVAISHWRLKLIGEVPTGWYPTAVVATGGRLFIANAKGYRASNPNGKPSGPSGSWRRYIENILDGTVQWIPAPTKAALPTLTAQVTANNRAVDVSPLPRTE